MPGSGVPMEAVVLDVREDWTSDPGSSLHAGSSRHGPEQRGQVGGGVHGVVAMRNRELSQRSERFVLRVRRDAPFRHLRSLLTLVVLVAVAAGVAGIT